MDVTTAVQPRKVPRVAPVKAVHLQEVSCRFGRTQALAAVDLSVRPGEIHALLGPNGAGKTTLLRVVAGLQRPTGGQVRVLGVEPRLTSRAARRSIGLVPSGSRSFYLRISGFENLNFFARLYGLPRRQARERARSCLQAVGLEDDAGKRVGLYSNGMQQRLSVARALLHGPTVLLADEATHDLDPRWAQQVRELCTTEAANGAAILWATQRLDEIRGFAHQVTVLHKGGVRFEGSVPQLLASTTTQRFLIRVTDRRGGPQITTARLRAALGSLGEVDSTADPEHYLLGLRDQVVLSDAFGALGQEGIGVLSCREERSLVEAALLRLTKDGGTSTGKVQS